jgi:hypothetical protein
LPRHLNNQVKGYKYILLCYFLMKHSRQDRKGCPVILRNQWWNGDDCVKLRYVQLGWPISFLVVVLRLPVITSDCAICRVMVPNLKRTSARRLPVAGNKRGIDAEVVSALRARLKYVRWWLLVNHDLLQKYLTWKLLIEATHVLPEILWWNCIHARNTEGVLDSTRIVLVLFIIFKSGRQP